MHGINSNFAERLDKLERLNRTTMRLALTALLSTGAVVWVGLGRPTTAQSNVRGVQNEVRARKFVVVDDAGTDLRVVRRVSLHHGRFACSPEFSANVASLTFRQVVPYFRKLF